MVDECLNVFLSSPQSRNEVWVRWCHPLASFIKINFDSNSLETPDRAGFGCLLRDANGGWIVGFSGYCDVADNLCAELLALCGGLKLVGIMVIIWLCVRLIVFDIFRLEKQEDLISF